jgi:hypothetical protein
MTPAMNPGMKGQPQAGLAALAQPAQAPKGMSSGSMQQILEKARMMSDSQLADILSGKSMSIPQYVAMTEAMGRKSLRTAMQGAQAQQQAKQPSVKERLLAENEQEQMAQAIAQAPQMGGISDIPAPNMESVDMASGGIVAFQDNEDQPVRVGMPSFAEGSETDKKILEFLKNAPGAFVDKFRELNQPRGTTFAGTQAELDAMVQRGAMPRRAAAQTPASSKTKQYTAQELDDIARGQGVFPEGSPALPTGLTLPAAPPRTATPDTPKKAGLDAITQPQQPTRSQAEEDYLSKLASVGEKRRSGLAELKKQGGGEAYMQMAAALFGSPNLAQAAAKGLPMVASTAAATRKDARALESSADDYDLNIAKARAAFEAGDRDRAFKYKQAADEAQYRAADIQYKMASINREPDMLRTLRGIAGNPQLEALYGKTGKANQMSLTDAAKQWNDLPKENRKYYRELQNMGINNEQDYYRFVNGQLLSATIPGQGATTRPY